MYLHNRYTTSSYGRYTIETNNNNNQQQKSCTQMAAEAQSLEIAEALS